MTDTERYEIISYLGQTKHIDKEINALSSELKKLESNKFSLGGNVISEKVQSSTSGDAPFTHIIEAIADRENEIKGKIADKTRVIISTGKLIDKIENPQIEAIMRGLYTLCHSPYIVAEENHCSIQTVYRLREQGLEELLPHFRKLVINVNE